MAPLAAQSAEPPVPARFQPTAQSRPIWVDRDAAQQARAGKVERLQWQPNRVQPNNAQPATQQPRSATTRLVGWEDRATPSRPSNGTNPFDDPFGDRVVQNAQLQNQPVPRGGNFRLQPVPNTPAPSEFRPAPNSNGIDPPPSLGQPPLPGNPPLPALPTEPNFNPQNPAEIQPNPLQPNPAEPNPAVPNEVDPPPALPIDPPPSLPPMNLDPPTQPGVQPVLPGLQPEQPCEQIYNGRNCCKESERCKLIASYIADHSISEISISVTPRFAPNDSLEKEASDLATRLARSPARTWRNRKGDVLGSGRMTNFQNGKVMVTQDNGEIAKLFYNELSNDDTCFVAAYWGLPSECVLTEGSFVARNWQPSTFTWKASAACHKPLYFDQVQVERYGHSMGPFVQPIYSGAHFFTDIAILPYKMGIHPLNECQYPLGYYRAGNCAPWLVPPVPISLRGAILEAGVFTGLPFIIP